MQKGKTNKQTNKQTKQKPNEKRENVAIVNNKQFRQYIMKTSLGYVHWKNVYLKG